MVFFAVAVVAAKAPYPTTATTTEIQYDINDKINTQNIISARAAQVLCTFLCPHCTTSTWKYLISRIREDANKRRRNIFSKPAEIIMTKTERILATVSLPLPSSDLDPLSASSDQQMSYENE